MILSGASQKVRYMRVRYMRVRYNQVLLYNFVFFFTTDSFVLLYTTF